MVRRTFTHVSDPGTSLYAAEIVPASLMGPGILTTQERCSRQATRDGRRSGGWRDQTVVNIREWAGRRKENGAIRQNSAGYIWLLKLRDP